MSTNIPTTTELVGTTSTDYPVLEVTMAITTIVVLVLCAVVLFAMIVHLIKRSCHKWRKKHKEKNKINKDAVNKVMIFLIITIIGIAAFEIALLLIIMVVLEIFLLDDEIKQSMISPDFFFATYPIFEYMIAIFDSIGHLTMLAVFIARFQYVFRSEIFNQPKIYIRFMYFMLAILTIGSLVILFYLMPSEEHKADLLGWEIAWEICVESVILFILILFMYNLYKLLSFSLLNHLSQNKNKKQLLSELTKLSLETSRTNSSNKSNKSKKKGESKSNKSTLKMTIDGNTVDPIEPMSNNKSYLSVNKSFKSTDDKSDVESDGNISDNPSFNDGVSNSERTKATASPSQALEIVTAMNKMTLLVIIAATGSFMTIIGNFIIETYGRFNEKDMKTDKGLDHDAIWVFILPTIDMVITSFMLYLQFNFTHKMYKVIMCHCLDSVFLRCMLGIIGYCWMRNGDDAPSFGGHKDENKNSLELHTKSTATSTPVNESEHVGLKNGESSDEEVP